MPPDVLTFTVTIYNKGKRSKDTEVAELTVELNNLKNGDEVKSASSNYWGNNVETVGKNCFQFKDEV